MSNNGFSDGDLVIVQDLPGREYSKPVEIEKIYGSEGETRLKEEVHGTRYWNVDDFRRPDARELIAYDASDGIENALYPGRWVILSETPSNFTAAFEGADAMLSFLHDHLGNQDIAFAIKTGDHVAPYEGA